MTNQKIFNKLLSAIGNPFGVCGLMGNIKAESGMKSTNMQNSCETRLKMNDDSYTQAVDNDTYLNFASDRVGYGLCQWTSSGRKSALLAFAKQNGKSIGDADMQIDFLIYELSNSYKNVFSALKSATSVKEASDMVVTKYERPADQSEGVLKKRASYGQAFYDEFVKENGKDDEKMGKYASNVVEQAKAWLGRKESDGTHKTIIDVYNAHKPLARGYKVKYTDSWCATFVSAVAIKLGYTDIIPTECSCQKMIDLFKVMGCWVENENRTPKAGDIIFYDWEDSGAGDNTGWSDHVGIVENVSGGTITVIEGNYSNSVKRRTLSVNGKYIRGYGVPRYDAETVASNPTSASKPTASATSKPVTTKTAKKSAKSYLASVAGTYKVTASKLNVREGAGVTHASMVAIPKGTAVKCYGYYTSVLGTKWLYIQFTYNGVQYTGFASAKYLKK